MIDGFRDPLFSVFQSAMSHWTREHGAGAEHGESMHTLADEVAAAQARHGRLPEDAPAGLLQHLWDGARLGFSLLEAKLVGDTARADALRAQLVGSPFDPNWIRTLLQHEDFFFGKGGKGVIPYIRAASVGETVLTMPDVATIGLIADWGSGTSVARNLLTELARQQPDMLIHLGDIYYSGTPAECDVNFRRIIDATLDRARTGVPVFTLAGNHDMYSGGLGYYGLIQSLNEAPLRQPASFFCLRDTAARWQFLAMDTGLHDASPLDNKAAMTFLEPDEEDWLARRIAEFPGRTILLSHHQPFSALSQIGPENADGTCNPTNPKLMQSYRRLAAAAPGRIAAWFWGHEHVLSLYAPYAGVGKGRCIGCGALPVRVSDKPYAPLPNLIDPPPILPVILGSTERMLNHGFVILRLLADGSARAEYYQDTDGTVPIHTEVL